MMLYHFCKAAHAVENVEKRRLKISTFGDMNDPFELLGGNTQDRTARQGLKRWAQREGEKKGLLCFSSSWKNPVMWSHYADRHRGIVLGFEVAQELAHHVSYRAERLDCELQHVDGLPTPTPDDQARLLTTKFKHWEYEREVRVIVDLGKAVPDNGLYFQPFSDQLHLKEIRLGHDCPLSTAEAEALAESCDAVPDVFQTRLAFGTYNVCLDQRYKRSKRSPRKERRSRI